MAIQPYNYTDPTKNTVKTVSTGGTGKIAPFTYAPTPPPVNKDNSFLGIVKNTVTGLPAAAMTVGKAIVQPVIDQWNSGQQQIDQPFIDKGSAGRGSVGQGKAIEGAMSVGSGVVSKLTAPLAPLFSLVGKSIDAYINTPYMQNVLNNPEYQKAALSPQGEAINRGVQDLSNATNIAMGILGGIEGFKSLVEDRPGINMARNVAKGTDSISTGENIHTGSDFAPAKPAIAPYDYSKAPTEQAPIGPVPHKTMAEYSQSQGYEPITPDSQLPTIQLGKPATSELPTIQTESSTPSNLGGGLKLVPEQPLEAPVSPKTAPTEAKTQEVSPTSTGIPKSEDFLSKTTGEAIINPKDVAPIPGTSGRTTQTLKPIEGTGELKTRGLSENVEANAIEKKLTDNFGDLPEYRQVSMADQARQAAELVAQDKELAKQIALGNKAPPKGLLPESVFVALEHDATVKGDVETLRELANSKLASTATTMGQRIRTLGERDSTSPIDAIRQVQEAREAALSQRGAKIKEQTITRIKEAVKKTNTKKNWSDFVESLQC